MKIKQIIGLLFSSFLLLSFNSGSFLEQQRKIVKVKTAIANNGVDQIICSCRSKVHSHSIEVIYVFFQILLGEVGTES